MELFDFQGGLAENQNNIILGALCVLSEAGGECSKTLEEPYETINIRQVGHTDIVRHHGDVAGRQGYVVRD